MSAISIMELNTKSPFIWDWDNLVVFPSRAADVPKKLQLVESEFEGIEGFEIGSLHSSGGRSDVGSGSGGSASNLANGSSSKSSKSASVDSSINREMRESKFTLETSDCFSQNLSNRKELASAWPSSAPSMTEISIGSGESLIGLKLGKRTYFEDVSGGINGKSSSGSVPAPSCAAVKKSKSSSQSTEIPRCQIEGCNLDLSSAKDYHRKHRVCEIHSKSPKVVICGVERRFCQQCSRFHSLSEFDQRKRSCRRRLSDHNARRRKPKPEIIQFNSMRLSSSLHEGRSLAFNQVPMVQTRPNSNTTWDFTSNSKFTQEKLSLFSPTKSGGIDSLHVTRNGPQETGFKLSYDSSQVLPPKSAASEVFHQGFEVSTTPTNNMDAAQDLRALSLLSTNSWGSSCPQEHALPLDHSGMLQLHQTHPLDLPPVSVSAEYNQFPEFQLFKAPNEPNYYLYEDLR